MPTLYGQVLLPLWSSSGAGRRAYWPRWRYVVSWLVGAVPTTQVLLRMPADPRQPIHFAGTRVSRAMASSDPFDFEAFYLAQRASVAGYFLRLTGDRDLAEDLTQETFLA